MKHVHLIVHYEQTDTTFSADYCSVDITVNGELVKQYGDDYHDKGWHKAEGYVDALKDQGKIVYTMERKADYEV